MTAYEQAASGVTATPLGAGRIKPGTIKDLVNRYYRSVVFGELAVATKRQRRNILVKFEAEHGDKRVALLKRKHIEAMFKEKTSKRFAARHWLKSVRALMQFAVSDGMIEEDPTIGIRNISGRTTGYKSWDEDNIAAFEAKHPLGTRERLALSLLLNTAQRRGDVVKMGRQHVRNGEIEVKHNRRAEPS
jgi:site-specific recombinase XerC